MRKIRLQQNTEEKQAQNETMRKTPVYSTQYQKSDNLSAAPMSLNGMPLTRSVEIVFLDEHGCLFQKHVQVQADACVGDALDACGIKILYPKIDTYAMGIYSKPVTLNTSLMTNCRIEIYRPLACDPKTRRRMNAKK